MKKSNKKLLILFLVVLAIMIAFIGFLLHALLSGGTNDEYGNRLNGIENYTVNEAQVEEIKSTISEKEGVTSVSYNLEGRLVNVIINLEEKTDIEVAKTYASEVSNTLDDEQNKYYDIQVYLNSNDDESLVYPQIGTKHKTSDEFVWKQ